ncbi:MAG: hypothetical protein LBL75_00930 [Rickettsiales bacterium]|jgi:hypothetical protein|nr:hypothetical protein [Rickettsiales bacterium]
MTPEERYIRVAGFYEALKTISAAIRTQKGIAPENYVGRFFDADVLEMLNAYGEKLNTTDKQLTALVEKYKVEFENTKQLVTPNNKPIYEMTLPEFERMMNI